MRRLCLGIGVVLLTAWCALASTVCADLNATLTAGEGAYNDAACARPLTIVIDAGHGGRDAGCSGAHSKEKHLALSLALKFGELIEQRMSRVEVIYTRDTDVFVPLHERARIANEAQADLFVSIHCNYLVGSTKVNGSETYVMGLHTADHNLNVAKRENAAIRLESNTDTNYDFDPDSPAGHIILSMFQHAFLEQSITAAKFFEDRLALRDGRRSRGVRQAGFLVLKETAMPSVLVESGYLSNAAEENYLSEEEGQNETAEALYQGFKRYVAQLDDSPRGQSQLTSVTVTEPAAPRTTEVSAPATEPVAKPAPQLAYYVQVAASGEQIGTSSPRWLDLPQPVRYLRENGLYKYQAGPVDNAAAAEELKATARAVGFIDAWVVAYREGVRVFLEHE